MRVSSDGRHVVAKGETLYSIARAYGTDIRAIVKENDLEPPYRLYKGQKLRIPAASFYIVKRGDTVWDISRKQNVSSTEIVRANGLKEPYTIYVGQKLLLPGRKTTQTASAPSGSGNTQWLPNGADNAEATSDVGEANKPAAKVSKSGAWPRPTAKPKEPVRRVAQSQIAQPVPRASSKFLMPVRGRVISGYGPKAKGLFNDGINIAAPRGTSVKAAENGVVAYTGNQMGGFGNLILVKHADGYISAYAHTGDMLVKRGDKVRRGQVIANVGSSGNVDRPQLHFQIRKGRKTLNPMKYIS